MTGGPAVFTREIALGMSVRGCHHVGAVVLFIYICVCVFDICYYCIVRLVSEVVGERRGQRAGLPTHGVSDATAMNWERLRW